MGNNNNSDNNNDNSNNNSNFLCCLSSLSGQHGNTAVHEAAWNGFSQTLLTLIQHRADVNLVNKAGFPLIPWTFTLLLLCSNCQLIKIES